MKAIVSTAYGSPEVLQVSDIEKPTPKNNEVLIRVIASSVTAADGMMREGNPYYGRLFLGIFKPKYPISGTGLAGVVESVGSQVERFNIGDRVFGESVFGSGTNAEYVCVPADGIIEHMPDNISFIEAAPACDGAVTAYNFLTAVATLQKNQSILIIGASGSIGSSAVQIARQLGARVTGVCSTKNLDMVESLGAHELIDYTQTDFTQSSERYDVIFDTVGAMSYGRCRNSLHDKGIYLSPVLSLPLLIQLLWTKCFGTKKALFSATGMLPSAQLRLMLTDVAKMLGRGQVVSFIDKCFVLKEAANAHRYVDTRRKRGNVVLTDESCAA